MSFRIFVSSSRITVNMIKIIMVTILICNVRNNNGADPLDSKYGHLVFSTLLYRHGDRSIERTYSNDPYENKSYWPMGFGQLTTEGIEKHFKLGQLLRKRYRGWLPELYSTEDIYVRSTDFDRTIISAQANLAAMYPPVGSKDWKETSIKHVQLVPIHTVPRSQDNILGMTADCPMYLQEYEKLENDFEVQRFYAQFNSDFEYIKNHTNLEMGKKSVGSTTMLYDSLMIESRFNYTLPKWTKRVFPEPLLTVVKANFELPTHTDIMKRLKAGPLLDEIVSHMHQKKNGTLNPDRMLWIYSAHDTTLVNVLNTMRLYEHVLVPYAAVLMIELRLNATGNYVVTVSYQNTSDYNPRLLHVPGCDFVACDLDMFTNVLRPVLPVNWETECKPKIENNILETLFYLVGIIIGAVVIMLTSYVIADKIVFCFRRKTDYQTYSELGTEPQIYDFQTLLNK